MNENAGLVERLETAAAGAPTEWHWSACLYTEAAQRIRELEAALAAEILTAIEALASKEPR